MKHINIYVIVFVFLFLSLNMAETWQPIYNLNINIDYEDCLDLYTDVDGNHVIHQNDQNLTYYLYSSTGSLIRSVVIDNLNEYPRLSKITGYEGKVYILYKKGVQIRVKKSTDAGQNWTEPQSISLATDDVNGIDACSDERGVHFVWANNYDWYETGEWTYETFYRRLDFVDNEWHDNKWVTEYQDEVGGFPSVSAITNSGYYGNDYIDVSCSFSEGLDPVGNLNGDSKTRKKRNNSWDNFLQILVYYAFDRVDCARTKIFDSDNYSHLFFYKTVYKDNRWYFELYHNKTHYGYLTNRWLMSNSTVISYGADPGETFIDIAETENSKIHIVYTNGQYRYYFNNIWSGPFSFGENPEYFEFLQQISGNGNDVYVIWADDDYSGYSLYMRQCDYPPLKPKNLMWSDTINNHPKIIWDKIECDIDEYEVWRAMGNISPLDWGTVPIANTSNPYYIDEDITISQGGYGPNYANYKVKARDYEGNESEFSDELQIQFMSPNGSESIKLAEMTTGLLPGKLQLYENYPNPFNPDTKIEYQLPEASFINISIFNILGQRVKTLVSETQDAGYHQAIWNGLNDNGKHVPSGIYFYNMNTARYSKTRKMVMLK